MATDIIERLKAQLPELEHGQETHRQWRDCDQKYRDQNPQIGSVEHHDKMVRVYQDRIDVINAAIAELDAERKHSESVAESRDGWMLEAHRLRERAERAEAACAAKDEEIKFAIGNLENLVEIYELGIEKDWGAQCGGQAHLLRRALSTDAGRALLAERDRLREALERIRALPRDYTSPEVFDRAVRDITDGVLQEVQHDD